MLLVKVRNVCVVRSVNCLYISKYFVVFLYKTFHLCQVFHPLVNNKLF